MRRARLLVLCLFLVSLPAFADDLTSLTQFRTGVFTDSIGTANLVVRDVTRDGIADLVSCSDGAAFVLTRSGTTLTPSWFSEPVGCSAVTVGDATGDGYYDVIVGASNLVNGYATGGSVVVYDPLTLGPAKARVVIPGTNPITDIAYGDVDRDGRPEIIAITSVDAFVYDAATLTLEWSALGKGGSKVALGDLEGDGGIEIVVNGSSGHVLDAYAQYEKWGYVGGFGRSMAVGDVDQDGKAEIVFIPNSPSDTVTIIEGDTFQVSNLTVTGSDKIAIADANADGVPELIVAGQYSTIRGIRRSNAQVLWTISNPGSYTNGVTAGDVDGDGAPEVIWGSSSVLYTGSATTQTVKWHSADLDNDFGGVVADVDGDGKLELVMKTTSTEGGNSGGIVQIFDLQTRALKSSIAPPTGYSSRRIQRIAVAQMDADPALEIVVLALNSYDPYLYVFDGVTGVLEYQSPYTSYSSAGFSMNALWVGNVDGDATNEIVVGTTDQKVEVLNGASSFIQWSSVALDGYIYDLAVADVDHDGTLEVVAATSGGFWVFNAATGAVRSHITLSSVYHVAATSE
ncbi:MAG: hypothetical protein QOI98_3127, partial [Solirubrobacteraceae bacterium]|nr:hypothetical protein [Solirubrobacteraceae bacterium]